MLNALDKNMLDIIAGLHEIPQGAYSIRKNGESISKNSSANIEIIQKSDKPGIDVIVKPQTKEESVHIPVIVSKEGIHDVVYNTFEIGEGSDILIVAGCGIHNPGHNKSEHDGIHEFIVRKGARLRYVEKHYAEGEGQGEKVLNPKTIIEVEEGGIVELELVQIRGVDYTKRDTEIRLHKDARLVTIERMLTNKQQTAESKVNVELKGENSTCQVISRSVAQDQSKQLFYFNMLGYNNCRGHIQCDSIIMHDARVTSIPQISAYHTSAELIHEATIGRIASEQLLKLMSLGLTEQEAEEAILEGFLR